jgi:nucleoside-diphosphate-sugar epimerase
MGDMKVAIHQGSKILVTGGNGFIGSHMVDQLLNLGYLVRGTVRDSKPWLNKLFDGKYGKGKFETFIFPDLTSEFECEKAVVGIFGIIHVVRGSSVVPAILKCNRLTSYRWPTY